MNKRIRELAEQAYEQQPLMVVNPQTYEPEHKIGNGEVPMYHRVFNQEKFAELIVKECAKLCYDRAYKGTLGSVTDGAMLCANDIKEHFGVEK
jgi:hypothetical protein